MKYATAVRAVCKVQVCPGAMIQAPPFYGALPGQLSSITGAGEGALLGNLVNTFMHGKILIHLLIPWLQKQEVANMLLRLSGQSVRP